MATYNVNLTPSFKNQASEGALDTSVVAGVSKQRTMDDIMVKNGPNRKILFRMKDGSTYDDTTFATVVHDLPAGNPAFEPGTPKIASNNVTAGHPTASRDTGSTI